MPQSAPYVTYALIGVTVFVFVLQLLSIAIFGRYSGGADVLQAFGALIPGAIRGGQVWRLLTPVLLHDNSFPFFHILFNMYALYVLGIGVERNFGHNRFLSLYLLSGFSGNVLSFLFLGDQSYSVGASTAIFGLIGAEGVFLYQNRKLFGDRAKKAIGNIVFIAAFNLIVIGSMSFIDNWGHIGGLVGGLMFAWFAGPIWGIEGIQPMLQLVDKRSSRGIVTGAAMILLIFGGLAMWGMVK
jgi:rhomboid protease GluP